MANLTLECFLTFMDKRKIAVFWTKTWFTVFFCFKLPKFWRQDNWIHGLKYSEYSILELPFLSFLRHCQMQIFLLYINNHYVSYFYNYCLTVNTSLIGITSYPNKKGSTGGWFTSPEFLTLPILSEIKFGKSQ